MLAEVIDHARRLAHLLTGLALLLAGAGGCGGDMHTSCGAGARLVDGVCLPTVAPVTCGAGTEAVGAVCVPADATTVIEDTASADQDAGPADTGAVVDTAADASIVTCDPPCETGQTCGISGLCVPKPAPTGWTCGAAAYGEGANCDCACGAPDPDCANVALPVLHCASGQCNADGTCGTCTPQCTGKTCGPDGCGGNCGACADPGAPDCMDGACSACKPACGFTQCGADGCGGSCGTCKAGSQCMFGQCAPLPGDASCQLICGGVAASGCSCKGECASLGTCCADFVQACGCVPACTGKTCGADGCGGTCGACKAGELCTSSNCVDDPCQPDPCGGHGTCAPATAACTCASAYAGPACAECAPGLVDYPACKPNLCPASGKACNGHGACAPGDGSCTCALGFAGATCEKCATGGGIWPDCVSPCAGVDCNDGNPCTDDSCNAGGKCVHVANTVPCSDGNVCTGEDHCLAGTCLGAVKVCDLAVNATGDGDDGACTPSHCSLREAIVAANADPGATVIGFTGGKAIAVTKDLPAVTAPLMLDGMGFAVVIDGGKKARLFTTTADLTLARLTIQGGVNAVAGGAAAVAGKLAAAHVRFVGNQAGTSGGAVFAGGDVSLDHCVFVDNHALGTGVEQGGGAMAASGEMAIQDCTFAGNSTKGQGGAVAAGTSSIGTIRRSSMLDNQAVWGGGLANQGTLSVVNCTLAGNSASDSGGAVYDSGNTVLLHCSLLGNGAPKGTGVAGAGELSLKNTWLAGSTGGGADCDAVSVVGSVGSLVGDGTCGATGKGDPAAGKPGDWGGPTPTVALATGSTAVDGADDAACADALVGGVDQRGLPRPVGSHCDIGAFELGAPPCVGAAVGATCTDGDACTIGDHCDNGSCLPGTASNCDDGLDCTADACTTWGGCSHGPSSAGCTDGNACSDKDFCAAGSCQPGPSLGCDDGNSCTADSCEPSSGCTHSPTVGACSDGDLCSQGDVCLDGKCTAGSKVCTQPAIAGLVAHYAATVPGALQVDAGGQVTLWKDLSGNGRDLTPNGTGPVVDPLGVYGTQAIDFAGGKGLQSKAFPLTDELTVFLVVRVGKSANWGSLAHHGNRDSDWAIEQNGLKSPTTVHFQSSDDNNGAELALQPGLCYVLSARIAGGKRTFTATAATTAATAADGSSIAPGEKVLYVGKSDVGEAANAAIGEILYYDKPLSDTDRASVVTYLRAAWGFALPKPDVVWFDASAASTLVLDDAVHLSTWADISGLGHHATLAAKPGPEVVAKATPNGKSAVRFVDASTQLQTAPLAGGPQQTAFVVARIETPQDQGILLSQAGVFALRESPCCGGDAKLTWSIGAGNGGPQIGMNTGTWQVITAMADATVATLTTSAGQTAQVNLPGVVGTANLLIGNGPGKGAAMGGMIAEVRVFSSALQPLDRAAIEAELKAKFGL